MTKKNELIDQAQAEMTEYYRLKSESDKASAAAMEAIEDFQKKSAVAATKAEAVNRYLAQLAQKYGLLPKLPS